MWHATWKFSHLYIAHMEKPFGTLSSGLLHGFLTTRPIIIPANTFNMEILLPRDGRFDVLFAVGDVVVGASCGALSYSLDRCRCCCLDDCARCLLLLDRSERGVYRLLKIRIIISFKISDFLKSNLNIFM